MSVRTFDRVRKMISFWYQFLASRATISDGLTIRESDWSHLIGRLSGSCGATSALIPAERPLSAIAPGQASGVHGHWSETMDTDLVPSEIGHDPNRISYDVKGKVIPHVSHFPIDTNTFGLWYETIADMHTQAYHPPTTAGDV